MTSQRTNVVIQNILDLLAAKDYVSAISLVCDDRHREAIYEHAWDLVLPTILALESDHDQNMEDREPLFNELVNRGKQKEVLLSLMEHFSVIKSARVFDVVLGGLQKIILSSPTRRTKLLQWVLPLIDSYLCSLPYPRNHPLDSEKDRQLLDKDPAVQAITTSLEAVVNFLMPFVKEVSKKSCSAAVRVGIDVSAQRELLQFHVASTLAHCIALHLPQQTECHMRICTERLAENLACLSSDLAALCFSAHPKSCTAIRDAVDKDSEDDNDDSADEERFESKRISQSSLAMLAYLLYVENMVSDNVPCVYSQRYILEQNLGNIVHLLSHQEHLANLKGIALTDKLVARQSNGQHGCLDLDNADFVTLFQQLTRLMIGNPLKDVRAEALKVFCRYLKLFDGDARYVIYCRLLKTEKHAGLLGFLLDHFRADLHEWKPSNKETENPFSGHNLVIVLKMVCILDEKEEMDLLGRSDFILAVLNLIRYVALTSQKHGGQNVVDVILGTARAYNKQLKKGLEYSKDHYRMKLEHLEEEMRGKTRRQPRDKLSEVGEVALPGLPPEQELDVVKAALVRFDLIECVLVLVEDTLKALVTKAT